METVRFQVRCGEQRNRGKRQCRRHRDLQKTQGGQGMPRAVAFDENNLEGVAKRAAGHQQIAAIQFGDSLRRNREEVESRQRSKSAGPGPGTDAPPPDDRHQHGNQNDAESGDEGRFRRRGFRNPGGLERVAAKHQYADAHAGPKIGG